MKFKISTDIISYPNKVSYCKEDAYFISELHSNEFNFALSFGGIELIFDASNRIVAISGYSNYKKWIKSKQDLLIPISYIAGNIICVVDYEAGFTYEFQTDTVIFYTDNYICVRACKGREVSGVKFLDNCIGFLDAQCELVSIWIER